MLVRKSGRPKPPNFFSSEGGGVRGLAVTEPLPKKKKNRAAQAERVRRELELSLERGRAVEECSG